jgi:hypothetical protein
MHRSDFNREASRNRRFADAWQAANRSAFE